MLYISDYFLYLKNGAKIILIIKLLVIVAMLIGTSTLIIIDNFSVH